MHFASLSSSQQLEAWLAHIGLEEHSTMLQVERVDLESIRLLTNEDFRELGIPLGHRRKMLHAIQNLPSPAAMQGSRGSSGTRSASEASAREEPNRFDESNSSSGPAVPFTQGSSSQGSPPPSELPGGPSAQSPLLDFSKPLKLADGTVVRHNNPSPSRRPLIDVTAAVQPQADPPTAKKSPEKVSMDNPEATRAARLEAFAEREKTANENYDKELDDRLDSLKKEFEAVTGTKYRYESPAKGRNLVPIPDLSQFQRRKTHQEGQLAQSLTSERAGPSPSQGRAQDGSIGRPPPAPPPAPPQQQQPPPPPPPPPPGGYPSYAERGWQQPPQMASSQQSYDQGVYTPVATTTNREKLSYDERMSQLVQEYETQTGRSAGPVVEKYRHATPVKGRQQDFPQGGWAAPGEQYQQHQQSQGGWNNSSIGQGSQGSGQWQMSASGQAQWHGHNWPSAPRGDGGTLGGFMSPLRARGTVGM